MKDESRKLKHGGERGGKEQAEGEKEFYLVIYLSIVCIYM